MLEPLLIFLAAVNLIVFGAHGIDKWRAIRGRRRIPEAVLLWLAVPGSAPGAWLGMRLFRHKISKPSFLWRMALVSLVNLGWVWLAWRYWPQDPGTG